MTRFTACNLSKDFRGIDLGVGAHVSIEQQAGFLPVALDGTRPDTEHRRRLFNRQASEEAAFDDLREPLVTLGQTLQGRVEGQQVGGFHLGTVTTSSRETLTWSPPRFRAFCCRA